MNDSLPIQTRRRLGYVPELDGVRGIAILLVMGNHLPLRPVVHSLLPGGFVGVDLFFVLSGFLITTLLVEEFDNTGSISLRKFYLRRALRLGPALVAFLIVFCALSFALYDRAQARGNCLNSLITLFYISNWVRVLTSNQLGLLAHTWSLSVEEQFYLVWPIVLLALLRLSKKRRYIIMVAAAVTLSSWAADFRLARLATEHVKSAGKHLCFGLESRVSALMIGCILGVILSSGLISEKTKNSLRKSLAVTAPVAFAFLLAFVICAYSIGPSFFFYGFWVIAIMIGCSLGLIMSFQFMADKTKRRVRKLLLVMAPVSIACLIVLAFYWYWLGLNFYYFGFGAMAILSATLILAAVVNRPSLLQRLLGMRWLVWLGSISYGLYLWHYPIFAGMGQFGFKGWKQLLIGTPLTFLVVLISYYAMEKPILEWKKRFSSNELQPKQSLQATAATLVNSTVI